MDPERHPSLDRILGRDGEDLLDLLGARLPRPDLTSLLIEVAARRAAARRPADILAQYRRDRFVGPSNVDATAIRSVEDTVFAVAAATFTPILLAPLAPLGTHSVLGGISQNRVVTTNRTTEAAADPTNALALEAAVRRADLLAVMPRATELVRLCAVQRVTRAQLESGPLSFAHFTVAGLVTAGRDVGNHDFEHDHMVEHSQVHAAIAERLGMTDVRIEVSDLSGANGHCLRRVIATLTGAGFDAVERPDRSAGLGYYPSLCLKINGVGPDGTRVEFADGGLTDWTAQLLGNRKERLMISGAGVDRLAAVAAPTAGPAPLRDVNSEPDRPIH